MKNLTCIKTLTVGFVLLALVSIATPAQALWWMGYHKPAFKGRVIDAETKEPIEGAVVVVSYTKETMMIPEHNTSIIEVKEALTDAKGNFEIPSYTTIIFLLSIESQAKFIIYKPGYGKYPGGSVIPKPGYVYSKVPPENESFGFTTSELSPEDFFSDEVGVGKDIWEYEFWHKQDTEEKITKIQLFMGVVELPRLKTKEERSKALVGAPSGYGKKDLPLLFKVVNEEERNLGFQESNY